MKDNCLDTSIQSKVITYRSLLHPLEFRNHFLIHKWNPNDLNISLDTEKELRGHRSASSLIKILRRARPGQMNSQVKDDISKTKKVCTTCSTYASNPQRFKLTIRTDELQFNHIVAVDIIYIHKNPVLHVVDEGTRFSAALFLTKVRYGKVWKAFMKFFSRIYLGIPDYLRADQVLNLFRKSF